MLYHIILYYTTLSYAILAKAGSVGLLRPVVTAALRARTPAPVRSAISSGSSITNYHHHNNTVNTNNINNDTTTNNTNNDNNNYLY